MRILTLAALAASALACLEAAAREEPLWEAGLGVAGLHFPHYRGSSQSRGYVLPAPYFVYRGDFLKADRHGLRGIFLRTERLDLNLSVGASLPVDSSDNRAREGMPDLEPSVEIGPSLDVLLWCGDDRRLRLDLRLPVRAAFTVESDPRFIGGQFFPHLNLDVHEPLGLRGWNLGLLAGPVFTDARNNRHFYAVSPGEATALRPAYAAPGGGYGGAQFLAALSKRYPRFWVGAFARYDTLRGAAFESSPLVTSKRYLAGGIAISWILGESQRRVPVDEYGDAPR
ncbi:MAG TPA: MipA/OmpV family protein [Myxococcota bacterium]|nr:MipA/OmpV family protein [Myxococcota bacterium]